MLLLQAQSDYFAVKLDQSGSNGIYKTALWIYHKFHVLLIRDIIASFPFHFSHVTIVVKFWIFFCHLLQKMNSVVNLGRKHITTLRAPRNFLVLLRPWLYLTIFIQTRRRQTQTFQLQNMCFIVLLLAELLPHSAVKSSNFAATPGVTESGSEIWAVFVVESPWVPFSIFAVEISTLTGRDLEIGLWKRTFAAFKLMFEAENSNSNMVINSFNMKCKKGFLPKFPRVI